MNPQSYELWYEHFSTMIRLNPRWDAYNRMALELFKNAKRPLTVVEFGFTARVCNWSMDTCFTQQIAWMIDNEYATGLCITKNEKAVQMAEKHSKKLHVFVPFESHNEGDELNWFNTVFFGKADLREADLVFIEEPISGVYDFKRLKPGAIVAGVDPGDGFRRLHSSAFEVWKRIA